MIWKQIKIYTADTEQSVLIEADDYRTSLKVTAKEEMGEDGHTFLIYMTPDEAKEIAKELIRYADELDHLNSKNKNL